ncbi:hypothetical protein [Georgenia yuyongxinii]|uniref:Uncharacterized protein n=1 Tax=Georgenia yuyongxinii TaxID=2589797 RepID=A0A552WUA2_9MICO|nr:hypothetical protein [Georgenia yuyongxinii]TRW46362.1 hypothetical protein FJ693_05400 [Georgenia yuyongxinii]
MKQSMPEVNTRVLEPDEHAEFRRRGNELDPVVAALWSRQTRRWMIAVGVSFVLGLVVGVLAGDNELLVMAGFIVWFGVPAVLVVAGIVVSSVRDWKRPRLLAQQAADYLVEISYDQRLRDWLARHDAPARGSNNEPNYYATGGQYDPARFSWIMRTHSRYELGAMRDYGTSADEWDANRPD